MRRIAPLLFLVPAVVLVAAPMAHAEKIDPAARSAARQLGKEALKLFDAGDYKTALDKFTTANQLVPTPTLGLYAARCLVKLGRLVEASERYLDVSRMQLERGAAPVMKKALMDAVAERDKLVPTIPTLEVVLEGPQGDGVTIVVDDQPFLPGLLGEKRPVDPGPHKGRARRDDAEVSKQVDVEVGQAARLVLHLPPLPPPPVERTPTMRTAAWIGVGVGAVGVVVAVVSGGIAVSEEESLNSSTNCSKFVCNSAEASTIGSYHTVTKLTTVGIVTGLVGLGFGIPALLLTPKTEIVQGHPATSTAAKLRVEPWLTPRGGGLQGTF